VDGTEYVVGDQEDWINTGAMQWRRKIEHGKLRIEDGGLKMMHWGKFRRSIVVTASVVLIAFFVCETFAQEKVKFPIGESGKE
jgi:hypothetical protein